MVMIPQVQDNVLPQGDLRVQANPAEFGAMAAQGEGNLASGIGAAATDLYRVQEDQGRIWAYGAASKSYTDLHQSFQDQINALDPTDKEFNVKLDQLTKVDFPRQVQDATDQLMESAPTVTARRVVASHMAMSSRNLQMEAFKAHADILGAQTGQLVQNTERDNLARVEQNPADFGAVAEGFKTFIGGLQSVDPATKQKWMDTGLNDLAYSAWRGYNRLHPEQTLNFMDPEMLKYLDPHGKLLQQAAAPGARVDLSPETEAEAPTVMPIAAANGVDAGILLAQRDVGGTTPQAPAEQAKSMSTLLDHYGGDYHMAVAAYSMGTTALDDLLQRYGMAWQGHLPDAVTQNLQQVMAKAGAVPGPNPPQPTPLQPPPVVAEQPGKFESNGLPSLRSLSWQQQDYLAQEAVRLTNVKAGNLERETKDQENEQKKVASAAMDGYFKQIFDPQTNGRFSMHAAANDASFNLFPEMRARVVATYETRQRELRADSENRTHPGEFRALMMQIHAADSDPTKTYTDAPAWEAYSKGAISFPEFNALRNEVTQLKDGNGNNFMKQVYQAKESVHSSLTRSIIGQSMPEQAADASYRFNWDLDNAIQAMRDKKQDPRTLLDPTSRDYFLKPEKIQSYMSTPGQTLARGAAKAPGGQAVAPNRDAAAPGQQYIAPDGSVRTKGNAAPAPAPVPVPAPKSGRPGVSANFNLGGEPGGNGPFSIKVP